MKDLERTMLNCLFLTFMLVLFQHELLFYYCFYYVKIKAHKKYDQRGGEIDFHTFFIWTNLTKPLCYSPPCSAFPLKTNFCARELSSWQTTSITAQKNHFTSVSTWMSHSSRLTRAIEEESWLHSLNIDRLFNEDVIFNLCGGNWKSIAYQHATQRGHSVFFLLLWIGWSSVNWLRAWLSVNGLAAINGE